MLKTYLILLLTVLRRPHTIYNIQYKRMHIWYLLLSPTITNMSIAELFNSKRELCNQFSSGSSSGSSCTGLQSMSAMRGAMCQHVVVFWKTREYTGNDKVLFSRVCSYPKSGVTCVRYFER